TNIQARRYDIPIALAAAVIEDVSRIASSSAILPGPTKMTSPAVTRRRKRATGRAERVFAAPSGFVCIRRPMLRACAARHEQHPARSRHLGGVPDAFRNDERATAGEGDADNACFGLQPEAGF